LNIALIDPVVISSRVREEEEDEAQFSVLNSRQNVVVRQWSSLRLLPISFFFCGRVCNTFLCVLFSYLVFLLSVI